MPIIVRPVRAESFNVPGLFEGGPRLRVLVCSCNIGNKMPTDLSHWIPKDGGHQDVIAIGMQESTFRVKAPSKVREEQEEGQGLRGGGLQA